MITLVENTTKITASAVREYVPINLGWDADRKYEGEKLAQDASFHKIRQKMRIDLTSMSLRA